MSPFFMPYQFKLEIFIFSYIEINYVILTKRTTKRIDNEHQQ
jgi:hypothetical protein